MIPLPPPSGTVSPLTASASSPPIRVALCDDSLVVRSALERMLTSEPDIRIVGRTTNGAEAVAFIAEQKKQGTPVDILILDIEMPVMDGLSALPRLLEADRSLKVIMASTLTSRGADIALRALRLGAADYVPKPQASALSSQQDFRTELLGKIRGLARLRRRPASASLPPPGGLALRPLPPLPPKLLAIGSSTGGPQALFTLLPRLGRPLPVPVILTQHMPPTFTPLLAQHLSRLGPMPCAEATEGEPLQPGRIHLAPGNRHLLIERRNGRPVVRLSDAPPVNFCRPAVDPMLESAAESHDGRVLVVMLTGMGHDGREGTRKIVARGGVAIAQDEATSVVWGMPGAIAQAGLCHAVLPLAEIAPKILEILRP